MTSRISLFGAGLLLTTLLMVATPAAASQKDDLFAAASAGNLGRVKALLDQGADANATNENGVTVLLATAANGHAAVVQAMCVTRKARHCKFCGSSKKSR